MSRIVIGFLPLFPYQKWAATSKITQEMADEIRICSNYGVVEKCAWGRYKEHITPVFVLNKGRELANYIKEWSNGHPEQIFSFYVLNSNNKYALVLYPHMQDEVSKDLKVYCSPIRFVSSDVSMFKRVRFTNKTYVGFVDSRDVEQKEIHDTPTPDFLGPFDVGEPGRLSFYAKTIFS